MYQITDKRIFVCSHVKDQRVMNVLSVLLGVDLKEAAEAQGRWLSIRLCVCVCNDCTYFTAAAGTGDDPYVDPTPPPTEQTTTKTNEPMDTASVEEISDEKAQVSTIHWHLIVSGSWFSYRIYSNFDLMKIWYSKPPLY